MSKINKMSFDITGRCGNETGLEDLAKLVKFLCNNSVNEEHVFNDIHISYDSGFATIEWTSVLKSGEDDCEWVFKDWEHLLVKQIDFPDGSHNFARDNEEETELWNNWKTAHPEWYEEDSIMGKRWVNKMEKYEDYPDDFVRIIKEHPDCSFGHVKEPDYDAEWEKTQEQIVEEEKKEGEIIPPEGWEPEEVGENPMLDEVFDEEEQEELKKVAKELDQKSE